MAILSKIVKNDAFLSKKGTFGENSENPKNCQVVSFGFAKGKLAKQGKAKPRIFRAFYCIIYFLVYFLEIFKAFSHYLNPKI